jgi:hypothetical protein
VAADVLPAAVRERRAPGGAGVVDEQVEPAVALLHRVAHTRRRAFVGEVGGDEARAAAEHVGELAQAPLAPRHQHQLSAMLTGEQAGGGLADAARGAGDDDDGVR